MPKIVSWNVNGLRAVEKKGFVGILNSFSADIFCVQETKAHKDQLSDELINAKGYQSFFASAEKKGYSGVACWAKATPLNVILGMGLPEFDSEGRVLTLEYDDFFVVNTYFPNAQPLLARIDYKIAFNNALHNFADGLAKQKAVVVCGDFNVAHKPIDLARPKENEGSPGYSEQERAWMDSFVDAGWVDTFRIFDKNPGNYTWWSYRSNAREKNIGWRIDYFCINQQAKERVASSLIEPAVMGSDHCPIVLELS
ncbi:MAG: exodeoxyribonuclease III [Desulfatibacillaceae bacterium]|nr:exodeoxyribonuclease III [Desulfatibacillaceae bacterium]